MKTPKESVLELLRGLPDDVSLDDIQYRIYVRQKVERAMDQARCGEVVSQAEVEQRVARWLEP